MMKKTFARACVATVLVATLGVGVVPAMAAQPAHSQGQHQSEQHRKFEARGEYALLNGHRGYKKKRPGYRYYNGYWFPPAAFVIANIIHNLVQPHHR